MTKRFYTLRDLFPLNSAFFMEIIILTYHFFKNEILKNPILNNSNNLTIIFTLLIILNIVFSLSEKISKFIQFLQYILLILVIAYYIIYTIAIIIISSGINWKVDTCGVFVLSLIFILAITNYVLDIFDENILLKILIILCGTYVLLLSSLSIAIGIRNNITHWNGSYLIFSLISFIILSKCVMKLEIRNQIAMAVDTNLLDIVISFVFFALFIIFLASLALMYFPKLTTVLNYWTPILALSIALGFSLFMYYKQIKQLTNGILGILYILFWILVPIILFILYLQRNFLGNYSAFKILLGIILALDAMVILAFGNDMKELTSEFMEKRALIAKEGSERIISKIKILLGNLTILVTLCNTIFYDDCKIWSTISDISNMFYNFGLFLTSHIGENSIVSISSSKLFEDCEFKFVLFIVSMIGLLMLLSLIVYELERFLFIKLSFKRQSK